MTKFLNISTDTTLGGSSASDEVVSSQKAIKTYIDANSIPSQVGQSGKFLTTNGTNTSWGVALSTITYTPTTETLTFA